MLRVASQQASESASRLSPWLDSETRRAHLILESLHGVHRSDKENKLSGFGNHLQLFRHLLAHATIGSNDSGSQDVSNLVPVIRIGCVIGRPTILVGVAIDIDLRSALIGGMDRDHSGVGGKSQVACPILVLPHPIAVVSLNVIHAHQITLGCDKKAGPAVQHAHDDGLVRLCRHCAAHSGHADENQEYAVRMSSHDCSWDCQWGLPPRFKADSNPHGAHHVLYGCPSEPVWSEPE